jgi:hypothetical protein
MVRSYAFRALASGLFIVALGVGCGGSGLGCNFLKPLPKDPKPLGFPTDQVIEGGIQARITKPGMDKLNASIPRLIKSALGTATCAFPSTNLIHNDMRPVDYEDITLCNQNNCPGNAMGCPLNYQFSSADGKDKVDISLSAGNNPIITVDMYFDMGLPLLVSYDIEALFGFVAINGNCTLDTKTKHFTDSSQDPMHLQVLIQASTDPTTGELTLNLNNLTIDTLGLTSSGCGVVGDAISGILSALDTTFGKFILNLIADLLKPTINGLIQGFLPKPLGLAGTVDTSQMLQSFHPAENTNLEMFIVPGGYVSATGANDQTLGLNLGVMSGMNSDRDQTTRTTGLTSEGNLCVPSRPVPQLASAPWMLPFNPARKDFLLSPAGQFSGNPEPVDSTGATEDVAIGISRTFLDLAGFHIYNSGTLCLAIGGDAIPQLNAGTLSVIISSLGNILDDRKAPLALVLRPQTPLNFTIGAGTMTDPLINVAIQDMRIDFYAWIEERYVRLLTIGLDLNAGLNLTTTKTSSGAPALQPTLVGLDPMNITIRVSNTDLLQEKPDDLAKVFPSLLNIATGALGGVIPAVALPAVAGFSLDDVIIQKVQTTQDDFLGIFATIKDGTPLGLIDWSNASKPRPANDIDTVATVTSVKVPPPEKIRALFFKDPGVFGAVEGEHPEVQLSLDAVGNHGKAVEWAWKIDNGMWHDWVTDPNPVLNDDIFLLQGRHTIDVRSRLRGDWLSEDSTPEHLTVMIDSMAPELHPARADDGDGIVFGGFDIVTDDAKLLYSWMDANGNRTEWTTTDRLSKDEMRAITDDGSKKFQIWAKDEAGNIGQAVVDTVPMLGFHGRTTNPPSGGGCNCEMGGRSEGSNSGPIALVVLMALVCLWRRKTLALVAVALIASTVLTGCNDDNAFRCVVDDDCWTKVKTKCENGQLPQCQTGMCMCTPDIAPGDSGRFSSMQMIGGDAYVSAYNTTYGDLMIGHVTPPGIITNWEFVDGVPDDPPDINGSHVRGGIMTKGDDVGRYTSIASTPKDEPVIAYYDKTNGALRFASFGVIRWRSHVVDKGATPPSADNGDDVGRWASLTYSAKGIPAIAYTAIVHTNTMSGKPESQLRWAEAKITEPQSSSDWTINILDSRPLDEGGPTPAPSMSPNPSASPMPAPDVLLPEGIALMAAAARRSDDSPAVAYYDRVRGNLRYIEWIPSANSWSMPVILDGEDLKGNDTGDVGLYPSLAFDNNDVAHITYENATRDDLLHIDSMNKTREIVDDGYRPTDEMTLDGLQSPVYHLVGDSSSTAVITGKLVVAYQDSTVVTLRIGVKDPMTNMWTLGTIAGHDMPFKGSFGFYACLRSRSGAAYVASYGINQQMETPLYFVQIFSVDLGNIM